MTARRRQLRIARPTTRVAVAVSCGAAPGRAATQILLLLLALSIGACDVGGSGGGSGASPTASVSAVQSIDLPAGQTQATLAWMPSLGNVNAYQVYEARNGNDYAFLESVAVPQVTISGNDGDVVRISVLAINASGRPSNSSPPSPELRFHAANPANPPAAAVTQVSRGAGYAAPTPIATRTATSSGSSFSDSNLAAPLRDRIDIVDAGTTESANDVSQTNGNGAVGEPLLEMLVRSNARFRIGGFSEAAQTWLQARVEEQFNAGVRLVGSAELDQDGLRELIWQDPAGQLFVSSGRSVVDTIDDADLPASFVEGVRLRAGERFVALANFMGAAVDEWVVEDTATGEVWIIDGETLETTNARGDQESAESVLVACGDFDADGLQEFLWQRTNGELHIAHPSRSLSTLNGPAPLNPSSQLLAVADMNGDGSDDLISLDENDRLEWTLVFADERGGRFESGVGLDPVRIESELLFSLDSNGDGESEFGWLDNGTLEIRDVVGGHF